MFICFPTSYLTSFLRYCKDIINLQFWVLWTCPAVTSKNDTISFWKTLIFIFMQKIIFISYLFLEILQRYNLLFWILLVNLGTLGTPGHAHHKQ